MLAAREKVIEDIERAWKLSSTTEELNLIVLDANDKNEFSKANC